MRTAACPERGQQLLFGHTAELLRVWNNLQTPDNPTLLASLVDESERRLKQTDDVLGLCIAAGQVFIGKLAWVTWRQLDPCLQDVRDACCLQSCKVLLGIARSDV